MSSHNDKNASEIVGALRRLGCSVYFIESQDSRQAGVPDLLVGRAGDTYLLEVKAPKGRVSEGQEAFIKSWNGKPVAIVRSIEAALAAVGLG